MVPSEEVCYQVFLLDRGDREDTELLDKPSSIIARRDLRVVHPAGYLVTACSEPSACCVLLEHVVRAPAN